MNITITEYNPETKETKTIVEREYTAEELAEQATQAIERQKQAITSELAQLDKEVPRIVEDLIAFTGMPVVANKQPIIDRKIELRTQLSNLFEDAIVE